MFSTVLLPVATATGFVTFFVSQGILAAEQAPYVTLTDPHVLRAVLGIGWFMTAVGLLAVAVGTIARATAGGIAAMVVLVLILPNFAGLLPDRLADLVQRFYPHLAGFQVTVVEPAPDALGPWTGFGMLSGFVAVALAAAYLLFQRRDA